MDPADAATLTKHRFVLVRDMDTAPVVDYLLSSSTLLDQHENEIESKANKAEKNRELMRILTTRGESAFGNFVEALMATQQEQLANLLRTRDKQPNTSRGDESRESTSRNEMKLQQSIVNRRNIADLRTLVIIDPSDIDEILFPELPEKVGKIGQGATSAVYEFKLPDESLIAGKEININLFQRTLEEKERLQKQISLALNEIKILKKINHENIVKLFGCFWDESQMILFMELMPMSVKDMICENKLLEAECISYSMQTATGLSYLHHLKPNPIVHRDIKCDNLLLNERGVVKLTDFGLSLHIAINSASLTRYSTAPRQLAGTHHFMAPEVLCDMENPETYGRKSDIWSFGCTIVEMQSGHPPFHDLGQTKYSQHANTEEHWRQYKGELLLPKATNAMHKLLNFLFIVDQKRRPDIDDVLKMLEGIEQISKLMQVSKIC